MRDVCTRTCSCGVFTDGSHVDTYRSHVATDGPKLRLLRKLLMFYTAILNWHVTRGVMCDEFCRRVKDCILFTCPWIDSFVNVANEYAFLWGLYAFALLVGGIEYLNKDMM